ncbi:hypothetical protein KJ673_00835 [Patescibacteria group bacterium]|nr:hypothetical protein [Patescibacteria group bacterium]MCG2687268.1 hypothetical protein [Candidatus Parcubacteria bacterium]
MMDLLGDILYACYDFAHAGFDLEMVIADSINQRDTSARQMFTRAGKFWVMQEQCMLADPAIKACGVNDRVLFIETAPIDKEEALALIKDVELPIVLENIESTGKVLLKRGVSKQRVLARTHLVHNFTGSDELEQLSPRMIWRINWKELTDDSFYQIVRLLDLAYSGYIWDMEGLEEFSEAPQSQVLEQRLDLQLRMQMEQRPLLCLTQDLGQRIELQQNLSLLFAMVRELRQIDDEQTLAAYLVAYQERYGAIALQAFIVFNLASKVKRIMETQSGQPTTWKTARDTARKIARKHGVIS